VAIQGVQSGPSHSYVSKLWSSCIALFWTCTFAVLGVCLYLKMLAVSHLWSKDWPPFLSLVTYWRMDWATEGWNGELKNGMGNWGMEWAIEEWNRQLRRGNIIEGWTGRLRDGLGNWGMGSHTWYSKHTWLYLDYGTCTFKYNRTQCCIVTCSQHTACTLFHFVCSTCLLNTNTKSSGVWCSKSTNC